MLLRTVIITAIYLNLLHSQLEVEEFLDNHVVQHSELAIYGQFHASYQIQSLLLPHFLKGICKFYNKYLTLPLKLFFSMT